MTVEMEDCSVHGHLVYLTNNPKYSLTRTSQHKAVSLICGNTNICFLNSKYKTAQLLTLTQVKIYLV